MRHVSRTHRVALDWLPDRLNLDPKVQIKYVESKNQLADILTEGSFKGAEWHNLLHLFGIMNDTTFSCSRFYSHSFLFRRKAMWNVEKISGKLFTWFANGKSESMLSRFATMRICGTRFFREALKAREVQETLKCGLGKKEVKNPDGTLFSMPRETVSIVQKILEVLQRRMRVHAKSRSEHQKSTQTRQEHLGNIDQLWEDAYFDMDAICGFIYAGELRKEFGIIQEFWISEHQRFVRNYEHINEGNSYIKNVFLADVASSLWEKHVLLEEQAKKWTKVRVYVYSDSVFCLGKCTVQKMQSKGGMIKCQLWSRSIGYSPQNSCRPTRKEHQTWKIQWALLCASKFNDGHWAFLGPGEESKWYQGSAGCGGEWDILTESFETWSFHVDSRAHSSSCCPRYVSCPKVIRDFPSRKYLT